MNSEKKLVSSLVRSANVLLLQKGAAEGQVESFLWRISNAIKDCISVLEVFFSCVPETPATMGLRGNRNSS